MGIKVGDLLRGHFVDSVARRRHSEQSLTGTGWILGIGTPTKLFVMRRKHFGAVPVDKWHASHEC